MAGTAQAISFKDCRLDQVGYPQAFNWFAGHGAVDDFHRVLRPSDPLELVRNVRDESVDWVAELTPIQSRHTLRTMPPRWLFFISLPAKSAKALCSDAW